MRRDTRRNLESMRKEGEKYIEKAVGTETGKGTKARTGNEAKKRSRER